LSFSISALQFQILVSDYGAHVDRLMVFVDEFHFIRLGLAIVDMDDSSQQ